MLFTGVADFCIAALEPDDLPLQVEVQYLRPGNLSSATIRPQARAIEAETVGSLLRFTLKQPEKLSIDLGAGFKPLYLYAQPLEQAPPSAGERGVVTFPAGQITEVPCLTLQSGQTLYLPGGAVFKGRIHVQDADDIRICGHGILDGSFYLKEPGELVPSILVERGRRILIEDITMVRPTRWMIVPAACRKVAIRNVKQIGEAMSADGIDVLGSSEVSIRDCFLHNNDDCVAVKAFMLGAPIVDKVQVDGRENVESVTVEHCILSNWRCGNAMEIGHELDVDSVRGVTFRDIDVLHVHGFAAVFSLHNYGRALVEDVLYEDIRIEHCYDKLIDFRISKSMYTQGAERGRIRGITLRNITWQRTRYNAGYTCSIISGWDANHRIENVRIENFVLDGKSIQSVDELEIASRHCEGIELI